MDGYVLCSYGWFSDYKTECEFWVRNTSEELEKFYHWVMWHIWNTNLASLIINGTELINVTNEELVKFFGKPLNRVAYEYSDIDMKRA